MVLTPPTGRFRYIALNNTIKPFDDVNVRKALAAAFDRDALRKAFGGPLVGEIPTHWIPPGQPGFDEAGGDAGRASTSSQARRATWSWRWST